MKEAYILIGAAAISTVRLATCLIRETVTPFSLSYDRLHFWVMKLGGLFN